MIFKQSRLLCSKPRFACIQVSLEALHFAYGLLWFACGKFHSSLLVFEDPQTSCDIKRKFESLKTVVLKNV